MDSSLSKYIESLPTKTLSADKAQLIWDKLSDYFVSIGKTLEIPDACPGETDVFMLTWDNSEHYLECEVFGDGIVEFFHVDKTKNKTWGVQNEDITSGSVWGEDTTFEQDFSKEILEKVSLFTL